MGLDMFLIKKTYIGNKYRKPEQMVKVSVPKNQEGILPTGKIKDERISEIVESIGYWRKANAIHKWFVDNVQKGRDDCQEYYVDRLKLEELLSLVKKVLEKHFLAKELLPCQEGFFFGSSEYDKYYFNDLTETKKILEEALKEKAGEIYYHSSW